MKVCFSKQMVGAVLLVFYLFALAACASSSAINAPRLTRLTTLGPPGTATPQSTGKTVVLAVGPINIPGYIESTSQSMHDPRSANISPSDQWIAPLKNDIPIALMENLSILLSPMGIRVVPMAKDVKAEYTLAVNLHTFEITKLSVLDVKAEWVLQEQAGKKSFYKDMTMSRPVVAETNEARASVLSDGLADVCRAIAESIRSVVK